MDENKQQWETWQKKESALICCKSVKELYHEGYEFYKQANFRRAAFQFCQAAELAERQRDVDNQCKNLEWEGTCWYKVGKLKRALERLLWAEELGGGDMRERFWVVDQLFIVANRLPLHCEKQVKLLEKLAPYKNSMQIGGSKSVTLEDERRFLTSHGDLQGALDRAQEAFACQVNRYPTVNDNVYYRGLVNAYRENGMLQEAWNTLRNWRIHGSTLFARTKSRQFFAESQLLYAEGRLGEAWDAIHRCRVEEQYLHIYGQTDTDTLKWLIRIAADSGCLREARQSLPVLFRFRNSESLYEQYDCYYWFAYYYAALWRHLRGGGVGASRYETPEIARKRAERWYARAECVGRELDALLETDVKRKELDALREKL